MAHWLTFLRALAEGSIRGEDLSKDGRRRRPRPGDVISSCSGAGSAALLGVMAGWSGEKRLEASGARLENEAADEGFLRARSIATAATWPGRLVASGLAGRWTQHALRC